MNYEYYYLSFSFSISKSTRLLKDKGKHKTRNAIILTTNKSAQQLIPAFNKYWPKKRFE